MRRLTELVLKNGFAEPDMYFPGRHAPRGKYRQPYFPRKRKLDEQERAHTAIRVLPPGGKPTSRSRAVAEETSRGYAKDARLNGGVTMCPKKFAQKRRN